MIITIDGYALTGKSTIAKLLANKIGSKHLNTGMIFRTIAHICLSNGISLNNLQEKLHDVQRITNNLKIDIEKLNQTELELKSHAVSMMGAQIANISFVREKVMEVIRHNNDYIDIVAEGRDLGTIVFPKAEFKFFFIADPLIRAYRLKHQKGYEEMDIKDLLKEIELRDYQDETRKISPLKKPLDAITINTSNLNIEETLSLLEEIVYGKI